ncbi:MAG: glycosyltransferase family 2 protein, partial [Acidobacteria bacterium]|nr:glycosyltransferase family 2 protein [Acidobacteriota bacterium]
MASKQSDVNQYVTAVLVSHDGATWITEVVAALTSQSRKIDRVIAIDTDSKDESAKRLRSAGITTLSMSRGTGFGDAIDEALLKYPSKNSESVTEWIWLIHDDSAPAKNALAELLAAIENRPTVAIAGPKIKGWHDRNHLLEIGVSIAGNGARWTGLEYREQDQGQRDGIKEELAVSTAGSLIRRDVYEELGGLDPNLSLFRDDVDFGWRANVAGHSVISVSNAVIFHAEAAASERRSVDVSEAFLHRPLLLDRRNAAYVILANSSNWLL